MSSAEITKWVVGAELPLGQIMRNRNDSLIYLGLQTSQSVIYFTSRVFRLSHEIS